MRRESTSKLDGAVRTLWIVIVVVTGIPALVPSCTPPRAFGATTRDENARLAESGAAAVDRLRARFRETLDLGPLYDEFCVADAARRNAKAGMFAGELEGLGVEPGLVDEIDDATLRRAFVAHFNLMHLAVAYTLSTAEPGDAEPEIVAPPLVRQRAAGSRHLRGIASNDEADAGTAPKIATPEAFAELVAELESTCADYRRVVTTATFDAPCRAEYLRSLDDEGSWMDVAVSDRSSGYLRFGVPEGESVVEVGRDGMVFYDVRFVDGSPKLVTFELAYGI